MQRKLPLVIPLAKLKSWSLLTSLALALSGALIFMLNVWNPIEIGPNGILVFFCLLYVLGAVVTLMALKLWRLLFRRGFSAIKAMYIAAIVAFGPVMILALNTLGQLGILDVFLVVIFESLAIFYVVKRLE